MTLLTLRRQQALQLSVNRPGHAGGGWKASVAVSLVYSSDELRAALWKSRRGVAATLLLPLVAGLMMMMTLVFRLWSLIQ